MSIKVHHAAHAGFIHYTPNLKVVSNSNRSITLGDGVMLVIADNGDVDRHEVPYGTILDHAAGTYVSAGASLFHTDSSNIPVVAEASGWLIPIDIVEGVTVARQVDEVTGLSQFVVIKRRIEESHDQAHNAMARRLYPRLMIQTEERMHPCTAALPIGTVIYNLRDRGNAAHEVQKGDIIARIPVAQ
jgi:DNA-directed RNA polymerase subunit beta'